MGFIFIGFVTSIITIGVMTALVLHAIEEARNEILKAIKELKGEK